MHNFDNIARILKIFLNHKKLRKKYGFKIYAMSYRNDLCHLNTWIAVMPQSAGTA